MTRSQMIETVARKTGFTEAQVETTMDAMFDQIADCLRADEKVTIAGFGRFEMRPPQAQGLHQPQDQGLQPAGVHLHPGFKASGRFKQKLEAGKAKAAEENA
mgnify:CR=1 FL=1